MDFDMQDKLVNKNWRWVHILSQLISYTISSHSSTCRFIGISIEIWEFPSSYARLHIRHSNTLAYSCPKMNVNIYKDLIYFDNATMWSNKLAKLIALIKEWRIWVNDMMVGDGTMKRLWKGAHIKRDQKLDWTFRFLTFGC